MNHSAYKQMTDKLKELQGQLKEAHSVIDLYAKETHWQGNDGHEEKGYKTNRLCYEFTPPINDSEELYTEENYGAQIPVIKCGKKARDYNKKFNR